MRHAGPYALDQLSELLKQTRQRSGLKEKTPGVFYRKSRAFLHFHEDAEELFADLREGQEFRRYPVNSKRQQRLLLAAIDQALK
jgi:hypothetical protein